MIPKADAGPEALIQASDRALYMAKQNGRNQCLLYVEPKPEKSIRGARQIPLLDG
jgi:predicted signal transduction protein with EAL and GGDEF domain